MKALAQTMMEAHDRLYVEKCRLRAHDPDPDARRRHDRVRPHSPSGSCALYDSGRFAAESFLKDWDFEAYVAAFRSGRQHSRRKALNEAIAGSPAPLA